MEQSIELLNHGTRYDLVGKFTCLHKGVAQYNDTLTLFGLFLGLQSK